MSRSLRRWVVLLAALALSLTHLALTASPASASSHDTPDSVGLVDPNTGAWRLRNAAGEVTTFLYGNPGDVPISGDWDGNGTSTPALYRQSDGFFYARDSNDTGIADKTCFAGDANDIPVVGDWDGDGDDNLGLYRPSLQRFFLFTITCNNSPMGAAQITMSFGNPGDKPVAGDWDGDGRDEVGLHRESTGFFYWRNDLNTGIAHGQIFFGDPGDRFVSGDWGLIDDVDTPAVFRPDDQRFYFRHTLTQGNADSQFRWIGALDRWLPVSGKFGLDGDPLKTGIGFDADKGIFRLGMLVQATGPDAAAGQAIAAGHRAFWNGVNRRGGVAGKYKVQLLVRDTGGDPGQLQAQYNTLRNRVLLISSTATGADTAGIRADAAARRILIAAGDKASQWALRTNIVLNLAMGTYFSEIANGAYWAANIANPPMIDGGEVAGIIYENSAYGQECKDGYDFADGNLLFNDAFVDTYNIGDSDFASQIAGAQAAGVDVLFICATPRVLAPMIGTMAALTYFPVVFGSSRSYSTLLPPALGGGDEAVGVALFNQFPYLHLGTNPAWETVVPGMTRMRADFLKSGLPLSAVDAHWFFGYTQGMSILEVMEKAIARLDITRQGVLDAVPEVRKINLRLGMPLAGYGPTPRTRIPTRADAVAIVVAQGDAQFGLARLGGYFQAPWLKQWVPS